MAGTVLRIGGGQGAFGESPEILRSSFEDGVDYVVCDSLAETTCGMFALDQRHDESLGWAPDLLARLDVALPYIADGRSKLITNAGGLNPIGAHQRAVAHARELGVADVRIGVVHHDPPPEPTRRPAGALASTAYAAACGIVHALDEGADVVITGRVADAALFLAPLVHELGWAWDDWDRLAAGITVGHLLECSGQAVGGNYSGDWWNFLDYRRLGSPIAEVDVDGTATITKPAGTSGRVSFDTVREQLLYEVHDPRRYVTPDVVVDLTAVCLDDDGDDRVHVSGARGAPRPAELKALRYSIAGYTAEVVLTFAWPDAEAKCRAVLRSLRDTAEQEALKVVEWHEEYFGIGGFGGPTLEPADRPDDPPEVTARLAWRTETADEAAAVQALVARIVLFSPAGLQGIGRRARGRAAPAPMLHLEPFVVDRDAVERSQRVLVEQVAAMTTVRLRDVCGVRSGDKGDISDITLFADDTDTFSALVAEVTAERVASHFGTLVHGAVDRYLVPNVLAIKFVLHDALGGGSLSLRSDAQGKTHGLSLLRMWVDLPDDLIRRSTRPRARALAHYSQQRGTRRCCLTTPGSSRSTTT